MLPLVYCTVSDIPYVTAQLPKCDAVHSRNVVHRDLTRVRMFNGNAKTKATVVVCPLDADK
jgi:hypothetical protein